MLEVVGEDHRSLRAAAAEGEEGAEACRVSESVRFDKRDKLKSASDS